eukprot:CAMPEP_0206454372 /NCGR_PEP_ID=MMETSP0324_2-20121206/21099_1 /ASSEMBLY_ACC=CAM_ASM_000836 /TAXON_ID=2866 /ORGANISM="Crypthecodinium cohnii, Strain Seligo" /LENGTH=119 /DNA_ID=CAMNT_0053924835 /DNA_START=24 /DNA_END=384 /DNA_ORIENTATION=+
MKEEEGGEERREITKGGDFSARDEGSFLVQNDEMTRSLRDTPDSRLKRRFATLAPSKTPANLQHSADWDGGAQVKVAKMVKKLVRATAKFASSLFLQDQAEKAKTTPPSSRPKASKVGA